MTVNVALLPARTLWLVGCWVMMGGSLCSTVTVKVQLLEPQGLMVVQVTRVVPSGKLLPLGGAQLGSVPGATVGFG